MAEREYHRLTPARPRSQFAIVSTGNSSLWLGKDHLLCVDSTSYTESYKRFYFRDIQSIIVQKTDRQRISSLILGFCAGICLLFLLVTDNTGIKVLWGIIAGLFGLVLLLDVIAGPSSYCLLRTAVQSEELASMNRLRRARRVLNRVRPLIAAAQGELTPEELAARLNQPPANESGTATASGAAATTGYVVDNPNAPPRIVS